MGNNRKLNAELNKVSKPWTETAMRTSMPRRRETMLRLRRQNSPLLMKKYQQRMKQNVHRNLLC